MHRMGTNYQKNIKYKSKQWMSKIKNLGVDTSFFK